MDENKGRSRMKSLLRWCGAWALMLLVAVPALAYSTGDLPEADQQRLDAAANDQARLEILTGLAAERPQDAPVRFKLGNVLYDLGQLDQAIEAYQDAIRLDPELLGAYVNLGSAHDELGNNGDAMAAYQEALKLAPDDARTLCNMGSLYFQQRKANKAIEMFNRALEIDPSSQLAHYNLAITFADAQIYREALYEWKAAVELDAESDVGRRSAENIEIINQMLTAEMPDLGGR